LKSLTQGWPIIQIVKFWIVIFCVCYVGKGHCSTNILSSTPHTCQLVWTQWTSAGIKTSTYTSICISFPPKISFVVVVIVALKCSEKSLGIENSFVNHAACCKFQLVLIDTIMRSQQNLYDCPWYLCSIFWWFKDVISVGETNVCLHNTKLHNVQTLVHDILVYIAPNIWSVCTGSLWHGWNLCCFHLSTPALPCFARATRRREHDG
jgi:hypothetical protein